jgi:hypothetical protein
MLPATLTWPGSAEVVTISRAGNRSFEAFDEIAEFLSSRYPNHFPPYALPGGGVKSVDQRFSWRAELGRVFDAPGVVLLARHSTGNNQIIAVAIATPTQFAHEAERVIQSTGGYCADDVDPRMTAELRAECLRAGMVLGRAEMVRKWVSL